MHSEWRKRGLVVYQRDSVSGGDGEDVCAGDGAGALLLQLLLDGVDHVEGVQGEVRLGVPLRDVGLGRVEQH